MPGPLDGFGSSQRGSRPGTIDTRITSAGWRLAILPFPESFAFIPASVDTTIRTNRSPVGCLHRAGRLGIGTHSIRRTKASLIYRRTKNLRAVLLLLGHTKLESTVRYLGIEVDDALEMAEQTEV